jgi:hypothetical protein
MSIQIDGNKVRFWSRKSDAIKAAKSIGWQVQDVWAVHTRFCDGYAIHVPLLGGFLSREKFAELFYARNGENAQPTWYVSNGCVQQ